MVTLDTEFPPLLLLPSIGACGGTQRRVCHSIPSSCSGWTVRCGLGEPDVPDPPKALLRLEVEDRIVSFCRRAFRTSLVNPFQEDFSFVIDGSLIDIVVVLIKGWLVGKVGTVGRFCAVVFSGLVLSLPQRFPGLAPP